jgi:serine/threonine protein kinase
MRPYSHRKDNRKGRIFEDIRNEVPPVAKPDNLDTESERLWNVVSRCLERDPNHRITAGEVVATLRFNSQYPLVLLDRCVLDLL